MSGEFTKQVIKIIKRIPKGKVSTYGMIAAMSGNHLGSRQVVRVLHTQTQKHNLPWHRVVNRQGKIAITSPEGSFQQRCLLEREGIVLLKNTIDLKKYLWPLVRKKQ